MRFIKVSLSLLLLLSSFCLSAQSPVSQDYVVTLQGDTLWGDLMYEADKDLSEAVSFQEEGKDSYTRYHSSELKAFGYKNGRSFVSLQNLPVTKVDSMPTIFVKKLVEGKVTMYAWNDTWYDRSKYFLVKGSQLLELSPPQKKRVERNGRKYSLYEKKYLYSLNLFLLDQPGFSPSKKLKYTRKAIQAELLEYNSFAKEEHPVTSYREKMRIEYSVMIGKPALIRFNGDDLLWRAAVYTNIFNDRSNSFHIKMGMAVQHDFENSIPPEISKNIAGLGENKGLLNLIPLGIGYQRRHGVLQPYAYVGIGLMVLHMKLYHIENKTVVGTSHDFALLPVPSLNLGWGTKVHIWKNTFNIEMVPTLWGLNTSLGVTF